MGTAGGLAEKLGDLVVCTPAWTGQIIDVAHVTVRQSAFGIAFLELREPPPDGTRGKPDHPPIAPSIREAFDGVLVLNSDFNAKRAVATVASGAADAITFGRAFLANPDLPGRLRRGVALNTDQAETWYTQDVEGYLDYPTFDRQK